MPRTASASPAGIAALLTRFPAKTVTLAKRCLPKLRRALPGAHQIVYEYSNSVVVSFSMSDRGYEALVTLSVRDGDVRLYVDKSLPAPKRLLKGSGGKVRYVGIASAAELDRGPVRALIVAAKKRTLTKSARA